jgi:hypothetical protein
MGGPKVFVVATLASSRPASPFAFRNYELPDEATPIAEQLSACAGSCKHHVWEVGGTRWPALPSGTQRAQHDGRRADIWVVGDHAPSSNLCLPPQTAHNIFRACMSTFAMWLPSPAVVQCWCSCSSPSQSLACLGALSSLGRSAWLLTVVLPTAQCVAVGAGCAGLVCCPVLPR